MGIRVVSSGAYLPANEVRNEHLAELGFDSDWIVQRTGIKARRHVGQSEATSDMAVRAAFECLQKSQTSPRDIDLILIATMTPDHMTPSTGCLVQAKLGASCPAMDINAACSGFLFALVTGCQFIKTGTYQKVLVIGAETMSMVVDPLDRKTYPLFGDGAAAVLLESDPNPNPLEASGIVSFRLQSLGEMADCLVVPGCGSRLPANEDVVRKRLQYLRMDGRTVFKWAVRMIPQIVHEALDSCQLTLADIKLLILHQANERIIKAATEDLAIDPEKVVINLDRFGNTSAASVAISINEALEAGRISRGDHVLMVGFGAGLTSASCVVRW
jgi:3-oxoacyl-[acyl-carrier-protein] synthase-3